MNTFKQINCPLCDSSSYKVLYKSTLSKEDFTLNALADNLKNSLNNSAKHAQFVRCISCKLVYSNPQENMGSILKGYENVKDLEYLKMEKFRKILSTKHLNKIITFKKSGRLLDVGCFCGFFPELAKKHGFDAYGIEPSIWARGIAKKRGLNIIGKTIKDITPQKFDIITLWDVIEHLSDPMNDLKIISRSLKKDGIIAIGTPNIEGCTAKLLGSKHPFLTRMHLVLFGPRTLKRLIENSGFKIIHWSSYGRTYPLYYYLEKLMPLFPAMKFLLKIVMKIKKIKDFPITINLNDEMLVIAKKNIKAFQ